MKRLQRDLEKLDILEEESRWDQILEPLKRLVSYYLNIEDNENVKVTMARYMKASLKGLQLDQLATFLTVFVEENPSFEYAIRDLLIKNYNTIYHRNEDQWKSLESRLKHTIGMSSAEKTQQLADFDQTQQDTHHCLVQILDLLLRFERDNGSQYGPLINYRDMAFLLRGKLGCEQMPESNCPMQSIDRLESQEWSSLEETRNSDDYRYIQELELDNGLTLPLADSDNTREIIALYKSMFSLVPESMDEFEMFVSKFKHQIPASVLVHRIYIDALETWAATTSDQAVHGRLMNELVKCYRLAIDGFGTRFPRYRLDWTLKLGDLTYSLSGDVQILEDRSNLEWLAKAVGEPLFEFRLQELSAKIYLGLGNYCLAEELCHMLHSKQPDNPDVLSLLGWIRYKQSHMEEAVRLVDQTVQLTSPIIYTNLDHIPRYLIVHWEAMVQKDGHKLFDSDEDVVYLPNLPQDRNDLLKILLYLISQGKEIDSRPVRHQLAMASVFEHVGHYFWVLADPTRHHRFLLPRKSRTINLHHLQRSKEAYERALLLDHGLVHSACNLAKIIVLYQKVSDEDFLTAMSILDGCVKNSGRDSHLVHRTCGQMYLIGSRDVEASVLHLQTSLKLCPKDALSQLYLATAYSRQSMWRPALNLYLAMEPAAQPCREMRTRLYTYSLLQVSRLFEQLGQWRDSILYYGKYLEIESDRSLANVALAGLVRSHLNLGRELIVQKSYPRAFENFDLCLEYLPKMDNETAEKWKMLGECFYIFRAFPRFLPRLHNAPSGSTDIVVDERIKYYPVFQVIAKLARAGDRVSSNMVLSYLNHVIVTSNGGTSHSISAAWHHLGFGLIRFFQFHHESNAFNAAFLALRHSLIYNPKNASTWNLFGIWFREHHARISTHCFTQAMSLAEASDGVASSVGWNRSDKTRTRMLYNRSGTPLGIAYTNNLAMLYIYVWSRTPSQELVDQAISLLSQVRNSEPGWMYMWIGRVLLEYFGNGTKAQTPKYLDLALLDQENFSNALELEYARLELSREGPRLSVLENLLFPWKQRNGSQNMYLAAMLGMVLERQNQPERALDLYDALYRNLDETSAWWVPIHLKRASLHLCCACEKSIEILESLDVDRSGSFFEIKNHLLVLSYIQARKHFHAAELLKSWEQDIIHPPPKFLSCQIQISSLLKSSISWSSIRHQLLDLVTLEPRNRQYIRALILADIMSISASARDHVRQLILLSPPFSDPFIFHACNCIGIHYLESFLAQGVTKHPHLAHPRVMLAKIVCKWRRITPEAINLLQTCLDFPTDDMDWFLLSGLRCVAIGTCQSLEKGLGTLAVGLMHFRPNIHLLSLAIVAADILRSRAEPRDEWYRVYSNFIAQFQALVPPDHHAAKIWIQDRCVVLCRRND